MKNTVNQYPPSTNVTSKKYCSTIVLERHSINQETQFRDSIGRQSKIYVPRTKNSNPKPIIRKLKSEIQIPKSENTNIDPIISTQPSL